MRRPCLFIERIVINTVNFDPVLFRLRISVDDCWAYIKRRINVSRPVKGSKPIFDRFHRLRYVSLEQTIRADNRGFRNFQCSSLLIIITINAIRSWKFKKEKRKHSVPHPCIRSNDSFVQIVLIPLETISTGEIITQEYSSANENVHNTDFVGLKNTRYIFFIERFANGIGEISFRSFPSFATRSPSAPPINQEDPKRFFAFARGQRKAWSSLETQTVVCTGPWRVIKGNGMEKRRGPRFAVSSEFESRRPTLTLLIPGARVPAGN